MEDNNLKELWKNIHAETENEPVDIKTIIRKKHCRIISRILHRQKTLICLFAVFLGVSVSVTTWDLVIMERASVSLCSVSVFLLLIFLSGIGHYRLLTRSADLHSVKESGRILNRQLERRVNVDFILYLFFFYGMAIRFIIMYFSNFNELKGLSYILIPFVGIFLSAPWLMRHWQKHRYRYYFDSFDKSRKLLEISE